MGKQRAPKPPDLTPISNAQIAQAQSSEAIAREQLGLSREQFAYFKQMAGEELAFARQQAQTQLGYQQQALNSDLASRQISDQVGQAQLAAMNQQRDWGNEDRQRYEDVFLPMQDQLIGEANAYDTPQRREAEAARQMVDVQRSAEAQRNNANASLQAMGLDPSQFRSGALATQYAASTAASQAAAGNNARQGVEDRGRALRADAIQMGMGLPSQVAASYAGLANSGNSAVNAGQSGQNAQLGALGAAGGFGQNAVGMRANALGQSGQLTGTPMQWAGQAGNMFGQSGNMYGNAANTLNSGYQNQMARWSANQQASSSLTGNILGLAGAGLSAGWYDGGPVSKEEYAARIGEFGDNPRAALRERYSSAGISRVQPGKTMSSKDFGAGKEGPMGNRARLQSRMKDVGGALASMGNSQVNDDYSRFQPAGNRGYVELNQGGALPMTPSVDTIPAALTEGEYVIPKEVVHYHGTKYFDNLVKKRQQGAG